MSADGSGSGSEDEGGKQALLSIQVGHCFVLDGEGATESSAMSAQKKSRISFSLECGIEMWAKVVCCRGRCGWQ